MPFVTCLCLTRNRPEWLQGAIRCFQRQTYPNRELLILADGRDVGHLVPAHDPRVRLIHLDGWPEIGAKRNYGCERAAGEIIAHWDDDDYSAPGRLADQMERLLESRKAVTGFHSMRFTDGTRWWKYEGTRNYALGTSLCYRRAWWSTHRFPSVQIGEDNQFVAAAHAAGQLVTADAGELMYATNHTGNTSPRKLGDNWKPI
jgi:glycosyltransferase involved in cell wall biosynthesis